MASVLIVAHSACLAWASVGHTQDLCGNGKNGYRQRTDLGRRSRLSLPMHFEHCLSRLCRQEIHLQI